MTKDSIKLSKKHGLNPSILICPVCGKDIALALCGKLPNDVEAPKTMIGDLCDECKKTYVTILEVGKNNKPTGRRGFIPRSDINIEVKDYALMISDEFNKVFINNINNEN